MSGPGMAPGMPAPAAPSKGISKIKLIAGIAAAAVLIPAIGFGIYWASTHRTMYIVNTTGKDGVSVFIDGQPVAQNLKNAVEEKRSLVVSESVTTEKHKIEAKDASGKVIDTFTFDFDKASNSLLYAPAHDPNVCFYVQTDTYGRKPNFSKDVVLDRTKNFWEVPSSIDYWFQDNPDSVKLKKGQSATKRALRQVPCDVL